MLAEEPVVVIAAAAVVGVLADTYALMLDGQQNAGRGSPAGELVILATGIPGPVVEEFVMMLSHSHSIAFATGVTEMIAGWIKTHLVFPWEEKTTDYAKASPSEMKG